MLTNTKYKLCTLYTANDLKLIYQYFKLNLDNLYDKLSNQNIQNIIEILNLLFVTIDTPNFAQEINRKGDIRLVALLEILFVKSKMWKIQNAKILCQVLNALLKQFEKFIADFKRKYAEEIKYQIDKIKFFENSIQDDDKKKVQMCLNYFRIFILKNIQKNNKIISFDNNTPLDTKWIDLTSTFISQAKKLEDLKIQDTIISILFWFCQKHQGFKKQCSRNGLVSYLIKTLSNPEISESLGRKCLRFTKVLVENQPELLKQLLNIEYEKDMLLFLSKYPNQKNEGLTQSILQQAYRYQQAEIIQQKIQVIKQILSEDIKSQNIEVLQNLKKYLLMFYLYGSIDVINKKLNIREWIKLLFVRLTTFIPKLNGVNNQIKQQIIGLMLKILSNLLMIQNAISAKERKQFLQIIINIIIELLNKNVSKKLIYQLIKNLNFLAKNRLVKSEILELSKSKNLTLLIAKHKFIQNFNLFKIIEETQNLLNNNNKNLKKEVVQAILNSINQQSAKNNNSTMSEYKQKLQYLSQFINIELIQSAQVISKIVNLLLIQQKQGGDLSLGKEQQKDINKLKNSDEQQQKYLKNQINKQVLEIIQKILKSNNKITKNLAQQKNLNKIIKFIETTSNKKQLALTLSLLYDILQNYGIKSIQVKSLKEKLNSIIQQNQNIQQINEPASKILVLIGSNQNQKKQFLMKIKKFKQNVTDQQSFIEQCTQFYNNMMGQSDPKKDMGIFNELIYSDEKEWDHQLALKILMIYFRLIKYKITLNEVSIQQLSNKVYKIYLRFQNLENQNRINIINLIFSILTYMAHENHTKKKIVRIFQSSQPIYLKFLNISYKYYSFESIKFTSAISMVFDYQLDITRVEKLFNMIKNSPDLIGYEFVRIFQQKSEYQTNFWQFLSKEIKYNNYFNNNEELNQFLEFLKLYCRVLNKSLWFQYKLDEIFSNMIQSYSQKIVSNISNDNIIQQILQSLIEMFKILSKDISIASDLIKINFHLIIKKILQIYGSELNDLNSKIQANNQIQINKQQYLENIYEILQNLYLSKQSIVKLNNDLSTQQIIYKILAKKYNSFVLYKGLLILKSCIIYEIEIKKKNSNQKIYQAILNEIKKYGVDIYPNIELIQALHDLIVKLLYVLQTKNYDKMKYIYSQYIEKQEQIDENEIINNLMNIINVSETKYNLSYLIRKLKNPTESPLLVQILLKLFLNAQTYLAEQKSQLKFTVQQLENILFELLNNMKLQINDLFYQVLNKNLKGFKLALKIKGSLGKKGIQIASQYLTQSKSCIVASEVLENNLITQKDFMILDQYKVPEKINDTLSQNYKKEEICQSLSKLVGVSSKYKPIQEKYKINRYLLIMLSQTKNIQVASNIIFALSGLVYNHEQNQKQISQQNTIKQVLKLIVQNVNHNYLVQKSCSLISNLSFKNNNNKKLLYQCRTVDILMQIFVYYIKNKQPFRFNTYKQILRALGNCSLHLQNTMRIVELQFMKYMKILITISNQNRNLQIIKYLIDVFSNLVAHTDQQNKNNITKLYSEGCLEVILSLMQEHILNTQIISSCIDGLDGLVKINEIAQAALNKKLILIISNCLKAQQWNQTIIVKSLKLILLLLSNRQRIQKLIESKCPNIITESLRANLRINNKNIFNLAYEILYKFFNNIPCSKFSKNGVLDCLVLAIKAKTSQIQQLFYLLKIILECLRSGVTNSFFNKQLFDPVILRMHQYAKVNQNIVIHGLEILKIIQKDVSIETNSCKTLIQFSYMFLTQTQNINYKRYQLRVAQFLKFLYIMISKSSLLKIQLNDPNFISVLQNWIKIGKLLSIQYLKQIIDICFICCLSNSKLIKTSQISYQSAVQYLQKGVNCLLYRRDQTNKNAMVSLTKQNEIIARKLPNGEIKNKYRIPITKIGAYVFNYEQNPNLKSKSIFFQAGGLFNKPPVITNCISLYGLDGDEIKCIDLEFKNLSDKQNFIKNFSIVYESLRAK